MQGINHKITRYFCEKLKARFDSLIVKCIYHSIRNILLLLHNIIQSEDEHNITSVIL